MEPFGLDAVLNYRKRLEEMAQKRFYQAQKVRNTIERKLREETKLLAELIETAAAKQTEGVEITELIFFEEHINYVRQNITNIETNLAEKTAIVKKEHERLVQKSKNNSKFYIKNVA